MRRGRLHVRPLGCGRPGLPSRSSEGRSKNPTYRAARVCHPFPITHRLQAQWLPFRQLAVIKPRLSQYHNDGFELFHPQTRLT